MWPLNRFPLDRFERAAGFRPGADLLERLRGAVARLPVPGGSAAFVSPQGLLLTNQHVAAVCAMELSTPAHDLVRDGYVAMTRADELPCPGAEVHVLESIAPVTARVREAAPAGATPAAAAAAMKAEMARVEQECAAAGGDRCEVVSLYQGGEYDLYRYRRHTDVRLVFVPEARFATFGGDHDNFEYPRWAFDVALLRVYEDGRPLRPERHLKLSQRGAGEGDVLLLAGQPGTTARRSTMAQLEWLRDVAYPATLAQLGHLRTALAGYAARGGEARRFADDDLVAVENSIKAISGFQSGLLDGGRMAAKRAEEDSIRAAVAADPALAARIGDPWREIADALAGYRTFSRGRCCGSRPSASCPRGSGCASTGTRCCRRCSTGWERRCRSTASTRRSASATRCARRRPCSDRSIRRSGALSPGAIRKWRPPRRSPAPAWRIPRCAGRSPPAAAPRSKRATTPCSR